MGNSCRKRKKEEEEENPDEEKPKAHRQIYVGDVPKISSSGTNIIDDVEGIIDPSILPTLSSNINGLNPEAKIVPVRRQSIYNTDGAPKMPTETFPNNRIISSRYTKWTFIPYNLVEQFRRIVNFYFLCIAIIQVSIDSPVSPVTAAAPLAFVIFVTALKQGYEDWLRHKADDQVNNRPVRVLKNGEIEIVKSKDVQVGDILKVESEEQMPTDLLLIGSSDEFLRCQINTANLDGETNLKVRYCPSGIKSMKEDADAKRMHMIIECEVPGDDLYSFSGSMLVPKDKMEGGKSSQMTVDPLVSGTIRQSLNGHSSGGLQSLFGGSNNQEIAVDSTFYSTNVSMDNLLLRGTRLKNTDFVYGVVIYTGQQTRIAMNSKGAKTKFSTVEITVNYFLVAFIILLLTGVVAATSAHYLYNWFPDGWPWYLPEPVEEAGIWEEFKNFINVFASFVVLFNYIIPISLYVTIEMQKFTGSKFFVWDAEMASETGHPPLCNTSDLNEELGQIEYLFSDKTGTLTENVMQFRFCSVDGKFYSMKDGKLYERNEASSEDREVNPSSVPEVRRFLMVLALCHTVQLMPIRRPSFDADTLKDSFSMAKDKIAKKLKISSKMKNASSLYTIEPTDTKKKYKKSVDLDGKYEFQASSPDEKALLEACYALNVMYHGEKEDILTLEIFGEIHRYKRHLVLEFDPTRKCMSVVVENDKGEIWCLTKGAETAVIPQCDTGPREQTMKHVVDFALMGMRTLVIAEKRMNRDDLSNYITQLRLARRLVKYREDRMREIYRLIESHLVCVGATGVEDQLQSGVPETLQALGAAGIRVWMLTGDKVETGVNVAVACGLITPSSKQLIVTEHNTEELIRHRLTEILQEMIPGDNNTFVIDGDSLAAAFRHCPDKLASIALEAFRVVCCRMTPLQKAQVVAMVKKTPNRPITAAIGDGANDVAMIQEAHIGIGILGKEGRQAARCSDFALARFSFLKKAVLVHGHWYYVRLSNLSKYFFYKNLVFILPQVFFCFHSKFSTQALFDGMFLMMFNIFFTSMPILIYGLFEQSYPKKVLLDKPHLYKLIRRNKLMTWNNFLMWNLYALWHAVVCYFVPYFSWSMFSPITDLTSYGTVIFCGIVGVTNLKMALETKFICSPYIYAQMYSYICMIFFCAFYSEVDLNFVYIDAGEFRNVYFTVLSSIPFWLVMILVTVCSLTPDFIAKSLKGSWSQISKTCRKLPKKFKMPEDFLRRSLKWPSMPVLFTKRTGKLTISQVNLKSYSSNEFIR